MKEVNNEDISKFLQDREVQKRVGQRMLEARSRATVSISVAANLSGFTESQLREWDKKGYLQTDRTIPTTEGKGHRQYTPQDLDKLMLMRELVEKGYSQGDILKNFNVIWNQLADTPVFEQQEQQLRIPSKDQSIHPTREGERKHLPIDVQVDRTDEENFWRYFVSQALRLPLLLITEDTPSTITGLILPLEGREISSRISSPFNVAQAGPALVGWLEANQTLFASYDPAPSFEVPSDFRVEYLPGWDETTCPSPIVIIQRKARPLTVTKEQVASIQRLIELVYRHISDWRQSFSYGTRDLIDHATNFWLQSTINDTLLERFMDIIVDLGGQTHGHSRWRFCDLFLPQDVTLPKQQRTLLARAQSSKSPGRLISVELSQDLLSLTYPAYQSGQVIYRPHLGQKDALIAYLDVEKSTRSAIAIPLASADDLIAGAIYIASDEADAFTFADQRALRLLSRMLEELLAAYQARVLVGGKLSEAIANPKVVDASFADFLSEEDFLGEFEALLNNIHKINDEEQLMGKEVSFIAIDLDQQSPLAIKYGDRATRNLSREVGLRLQGHLRLQSNPDYRKVYHIGADRYCVKLVGMSLEEARNLAEQIRILLKGDYRIDIRRAGKPISRDNMLNIQDVTVRLGVLYYKYLKLKEVLGRYDAHMALAETRTLLLQNLNVSLDTGRAAGGNVIVSWDLDKWGFKVWEPGQST